MYAASIPYVSVPSLVKILVSVEEIPPARENPESNAYPIEAVTPLPPTPREFPVPQSSGVASVNAL